MKIAVISNSLLLKKSLESFLKEYITSYKACDFVITDKPIEIDKPYLLANSSDEADIKIPFSKSALFFEIEKFYKRFSKDVDIMDGERKDFSNLEEKIDELTQDFRDSLVNVIKDYYEK